MKEKVAPENRIVITVGLQEHPYNNYYLLSVFKWMRYLITVIALLGFNYRCLSQTTQDAGRTSNCADKWKYSSLNKPILGQVVAHVKSGPCGNIAFASVTIIRLGNDTIRVLELCDNEKDFNYNQSVVVAKSKKPNFGVALPVVVGYDCRDFKTYYGIVTQKNN